MERAAERGARRVLVRCLVDNEAGDRSVRFVEESHYRLWQYLVVNRHRLRVHEPRLCVWLPAAEYDARAALFSRASTVEPVQRLTFAQYDPVSQIVSTLQRFVPAGDAAQVHAQLLARFPVAVRESPDLTTETEPGHAILRPGGADAGRIGFHFLEPADL